MKSMPCALAALLALGMLACSPSREGSLKLDPTPLFSAGHGWAVVKGAYVRLKESPSQSAADLSQLRRGEILEVIGRDLGSPDEDEDRGLWYRLRAGSGSGWARAGDIDVVATRAQAERSASGKR